MSKSNRYEDSEFFYGNLGNDTIPDGIIKNISEATPEYKVGSYYGSENDNEEEKKKIRDCTLSWLEVSDLNYVETGLRNIIENVNNLTWKFPLKHEWETAIQVTSYSKVGHHYEWHTDTGRGDEDPEHKRIISVVYSLSHDKDYEGGEFVLEKSDPLCEVTFKFDYGDFIVFPSDKWHKVQPLLKGDRMTLVGWYR
jgi:hypothetical protein